MPHERYNGAMSAASKPRPKDAYHHGDLPAALVREAVKLIARRGNLDFSLRDLAALVGVSHAAVYRHYSDKAALLCAVAINGFELLTQTVRDAGVGLDHEPVQQLARQGAAYVGMAVRHPGHFAAMFAPVIQSSSGSAQVLNAAERAYQHLVQSVMRRLRSTDPDAAAVQAEALRCWALVHGLACLQLSGNLTACLGRDAHTAPTAELESLVASLLQPAHSAPT